MRVTRILVIEDEIPQRRAICNCLEQNGYSAIEAGDGIGGLKAALREHPDLVLLDIQMPRMDGMMVMHKLREDSWGKNVPIIILTNYDTNDSQVFQIATDLPAFYLIKADNSLEKVLKKVKEVLESRK